MFNAPASAVMAAGQTTLVLAKIGNIQGMRYMMPLRISQFDNIIYQGLLANL